MPVFSRLGSYDKALLDRLTFADPGRWTEWWAHEAALFPVEDLPLWGWKKDEYRERDPWLPDYAAAHKDLLRELLAILAAEGPRAAGDIEHERNTRHGNWWGWSDVKSGLEVLFRRGDVVSAGRVNFQRRYALPEQVLPAAVRGAALPRAEAIRELVRRAAVALGVGTAADLADYFRLRGADTRTAIADLAEAGELLPVRVAGWDKPAWLHRDARHPRSITADALLSPFDPLVWDRERAERHFDFRYRIEIYTPAAKRVYGYYCLPILLDDRLVGRLDLKADRKARTLNVQAAWAEDESIDVDRVAVLVHAAAHWQGLERVAVADRGTLAAQLRAALP
jgi:uncharacterized protein YcaQ